MPEKVVKTGVCWRRLHHEALTKTFLGLTNGYLFTNENGEHSSPSPRGDWEVEVNEVVRGDEAWQLVQTANQFNDPPEEGMEYVAVKVWVRNIDISDTATDMDSSSFKSTGSSNTLYDAPYVVDPEPALGVSLFSGGVYEGTITLVAAEGEIGMMAVFQPWSDWDDTNKRFLSLEP